MPMRYDIDEHRKLVRSTGEGRITFVEISAHQDRLLQDSAFDPSFDQFVDLGAAMTPDITTPQAVILAKRPLFSSTSRRAFFASAPTVFGLIRMMQAYHESGQEHSHIGVFYERESAFEWLDAPHTKTSL